MNNSLTYNVLWIDDDTNIVESTKFVAEEYNLILEHYTNWEEAEKKLRKKFSEYSAIILDANCKIRPNEPEKEEFITAILPQLLLIFGEKQTIIPWYILSAGTMSNFSSTVRGAAASRERFVEEWGEMLYLKDVPEEDERHSRKMFAQISNISQHRGANIVLYRHKDVFKYLGDKSIIDGRARKLMLKMLSALYYPEENIKYEYAGNPIRKVMEYLFYSAKKLGLLTPDVFDKEGHCILQDANRYLSGMNVRCYDKNDRKKVTHMARWGNPGTGNEGKGGDTIFPEEIGELGRSILNFSNADSHTEESTESPYSIEEDKKDCFFGYVLLLCQVIKSYGRFADSHSDVNSNIAKQQIMPYEDTNKKSSERKKETLRRETPKMEVIESVLPSKEEILTRPYVILKDGNGNYYCGSCKLSTDIALKRGMVKIVELIDNNGEDADTYPYIAVKVTIP